MTSVHLGEMTTHGLPSPFRYLKVVPSGIQLKSTWGCHLGFSYVLIYMPLLVNHTLMCFGFLIEPQSISWPNKCDISRKIRNAHLWDMFCLTITITLIFYRQGTEVEETNGSYYSISKLAWEEVVGIGTRFTFHLMPTYEALCPTNELAKKCVFVYLILLYLCSMERKFTYITNNSAFKV